MGSPVDAVGEFPERQGVVVEDPQHDGGEGRELSQPFGEARPARPVAVFIPPAIFQKEDAVFDLPVLPHRRQELVGVDVTGIDAAEEVARLREAYNAVVAGHVTIDAQRDLTSRELQRVANISGVL